MLNPRYSPDAKMLSPLLEFIQGTPSYSGEDIPPCPVCWERMYEFIGTQRHDIVGNFMGMLGAARIRAMRRALLATLDGMCPTLQPMLSGQLPLDLEIIAFQLKMEGLYETFGEYVAWNETMYFNAGDESALVERQAMIYEPGSGLKLPPDLSPLLSNQLCPNMGVHLRICEIIHRVLPESVLPVVFRSRYPATPGCHPWVEFLYQVLYMAWCSDPTYLGGYHATLGLTVDLQPLIMAFFCYHLAPPFEDRIPWSHSPKITLVHARDEWKQQLGLPAEFMNFALKMFSDSCIDAQEERQLTVWLDTVYAFVKRMPAVGLAEKTGWQLEIDIAARD